MNGGAVPKTLSKRLFAIPEGTHNFDDTFSVEAFANSIHPTDELFGNGLASIHPKKFSSLTSSERTAVYGKQDSQGLSARMRNGEILLRWKMFRRETVGAL